MSVSIESLIRSPRGFGVATVTAAQVAACRIIDGRPLAGLRDHPDVLRLVGGPEAVAALPSERGETPAEVVFLASIRSLKTIIALAAAIKAALSVDLDGLIPGEIARVSILSLDLDKAKAAFGILSATLRASSVLRSLLVEPPTAGSAMLRHPSGRSVEIAIVAGKAAGGALVARWSAGFIADEATRMAGQSDGIVNLDDARTAVQGRLLPGAPALYIGSPWAPRGPVHALDVAHWSRPTSRTVVLRGTGPMLNPIWWTPERCAKLRRANPTAYRTDVEGRYVDPEATMFAGDLLDARTRVEPEELDPSPLHSYVAAMDPATRGNAWTLVVSTCLDAHRRHAVALAREWLPRAGSPLSPSAVLREIAAVLRPYGVTSVRTDQWSVDALSEVARGVGLSLHEMTLSSADKFELYDGMRVKLEEGLVELAPVRQLRDDLNRVKRKVTVTGLAIELPGTADGRHCDFAPSVVLSLRYPIPAPRPAPLQRGSREWCAAQDRLERERHIAEAARRARETDPEAALRSMLS